MNGANPMHLRTRPAERLLVWVGLALLWFASQVNADVDLWRQVDGTRLRVYYTDDVVAAERVARVGDALYDDIASRFELPSRRLVEVWLTSSPDQFEDIVHAPIQDWAMGYAFPLEGRIVLRNPSGSGRFEELDRLTRHEVAHIALGLLVGDAVMTVPVWFHEGFAMYVSEPWTWQHQTGLLGSALFRKLQPLDAYAKGFPKDADDARVAYLQSFSAVRVLVATYSFTRFQTFLYRLNAGEPFGQAFQATYGLSLLMYGAEWVEIATRGSEWVALLAGSLAMALLFAPFVVIGYVRFRKARAARLRSWQEQEEQPDAFFREHDQPKS
jgi:hypothetical protein